MKTIEKTPIWQNGVLNEAVIFNLTCINDNLVDSAKFYFALYDLNFNKLTDGNIFMNLPQYATDWTTNDNAYNWAAGLLNLTITGNYIPE